MGTTFVIMTGMKLVAVFATGIGVTTAFSYFHNFEWKPKTKKNEKKGDSDGVSKSGSSLRKAAGSID